MPAADDLAQQLEDDAVGTLGTDIFINFMPDSPDECIGLFQSDGESESGDMFGSGTLPTFETATVEVIVRAGAHDSPTAFSTASSVRSSLATITGGTVNGTTYYRVREVGTARYDGTDVQDRVYVNLVFEATKNL